MNAFSYKSLQIAACLLISSYSTIKADLPSTDSLNSQFSVQALLSGAGLFIENKGQLEHYHHAPSPESTQFYTRWKNGTAFFTPKGIEYAFFSPADGSHDFTLKMEFEQLNRSCELKGIQPEKGVFNYYRGRSSNWVENVQRYQSVIYQNAYNKTDIQYGFVDGKLKYDIILHPGANTEDISFAYRGIEGLQIDMEGNLKIQTPQLTLIDIKPFTYQIIDGEKVTIASSYIKLGYNKIGFQVGAPIDASLPIVIDPFTVDWGTHIAEATETTGTGYAFEYSMGNDGAIYGSGWHSDGGFPMVNAFDTQLYGNDATLFKMNSEGTALEYASFIGGTSAFDMATTCKVNDAGELYFAGHTWASRFWTPDENGVYANRLGPSEFPVTTANLQSEPHEEIDFSDQVVIADSADLFFGKLGPNGELLYSTLYGGPGDDRAFDIAIDNAGNGIVVGWTNSSSDFSTPNALILGFQGGRGAQAWRQNDWELDGFVLSYNPEANTLNYCSYFGGAGDDMIRGVATDDIDNVYICGATTSGSGIASGAGFDQNWNGVPSEDAHDIDGFVAKFSADLGTQIFGTYVGGDRLDHAEGIEVKCNYEIVISGYTHSNNQTFPISNGIQSDIAGARDGYLLRISPTGANVLSGTYIGGPGDDAIKNGNPYQTTQMKRSTDLDVNRRGEVAFVMMTWESGLPAPDGFMTGPIHEQTGITAGGAGLGDAYIQIIDSSWTEVVYGTYVGGSRTEINGTQDHGNDYPVSGIEWHPKNDNAWCFGGGTHSALPGTDEGIPLPTTAGSLSENRILPGVSDQYYAFQFSRCSLEVKLSASDSILCPGDWVPFEADNPCFDSQHDSIIYTVNGEFAFGGGVADFSWSTNELQDQDEVCVILLKHSTCREVIEADTACIRIAVLDLNAISLPDTVICEGDPFQAQVNDDFDRYLWSTGDTTSTTVITETGTYYVSVSLNDGCWVRDTFQVGIGSPAELYPQVYLLDASCHEQCDGTVILSDTGRLGLSYELFDANQHAIASHNDSAFIRLCAGEYVLWSRDSLACPSKMDITIQQPEPISIGMEIDTLITCESTTLALQPDTLFDQMECLWSITGSNLERFSWTGCAQFDYELAGDPIQIDLEVTNGLCSQSTQTTIKAIEGANVKADFTTYPSSDLDPFDPVVTLNNESTGASNYHWMFPLGKSASHENPVHELPATPGQSYPITLAVSNEMGCSDTITQWVNIRPWQTIWVPNAFVIGRANVSGGYGPVIYGELSKYEFLIYDRWGELIWWSNDQNEKWDGYVKGTSVLAKQDVYTWKLTAKAPYLLNDPNLIGRVTVVR